MASWRRIWIIVGGLLIVTAAVLVGVNLGLLSTPFSDDQKRAQVTISNEDGTTLATVDARVADTPAERYRGLSDTERLPNGTGMLFVFDREGERTFVMRDMDFPLDIIFIDADGRITQIHPAPVPPPNTSEGELTPYRGQAKWVLEVPCGYTTSKNISIGDVVRITYIE
ncbi:MULTISPECIES: DUF192 domain-containing protein [unclassified Haloferax]|uniref:DUF192 domain-containing protein n=1 Tax=unclassified Haloferax TaxID=2625095 RepID=UPI002876D635|nr:MULTISPECIES: DUF192 domain-containing protein [unclassified Haloferax]MDS0241338.1 DUF192 domain-containing protein [Haloferax sp. S2CR25]MDS0444459.1 DUF192 domain-containing protein [Haloferax sp. S2CR25-2]